MKTMAPWLGSMLSTFVALNLCAQQTIVLESFEDDIDAVSLMDWGGRPAHEPVGVNLAHYTRTGPEDLFVTHGDKSLKVTLSGLEWWSADFRVTLSETASEILREAVSAGAVGQYILRWDVVFPPEGTTHWMNNQIAGFGGIWDQLESNNSVRTMSVALDLLQETVPAEGPIVLQFAQNFDAVAEPFTSLDLYMDNIRLVDTYVPGAQPKVYVLQSFEDPDNPTGGVVNFTAWGGGQRTTYHRYTASGPDDQRVSHGDHALEVRFTGSGGWGADFLIPFADTILADILRLDLPAAQRPAPEQLARYTLRWDLTWPERAQDWTGDWMNTGYHTQQDGLPWSQSGIFDTRRTYSITLDQFTWADWGDYPVPSLMVIVNGAWGPSGTTLWFDNFVLIDTGDTSGVAAPQITGHTHAAGQLTLTWVSVPNATYGVERKANLDDAWTPLAENLTSAGPTTSFSDTSPPAARAFYRVAAFPPPPLFETSFEPGEDLAGWTEVIDKGSSQWQIGQPTTGPGSARTGVNVLATKLHGDYDNNQEVGYRSPVIDLAGRDSATLQFYHYYEFEPTIEGMVFDWGEVRLIDAATGQNLLPADAPALRFVGEYRDWRRSIYVLPSEALGKQIRIEFRLISDDFQPAPGWYIDDVRVD
jgi:hypothetical protein